MSKTHPKLKPLIDELEQIKSKIDTLITEIGDEENLLYASIEDIDNSITGLRFYSE